jgi:nitrilase
LISLDPLYADLLENGVTIPSTATEPLSTAARTAGIYVVIGISEPNVEASNASIYNTILYIGPDGTVLGKHWKLVPSGGKRLIWAQGDGSTLGVYATSLGTLGGLTC